MKDIVLNKHAFHFEGFSYPDGAELEQINKNKSYKFTILSKGVLEVKTEKTSFVSEVGEMSFIPPEIPHTLYFSPDSEGVVLEFMYWPDVDDFVFPMQKITIDETLKPFVDDLPIFEEKVDSRFIWRAYQFLDEVQNYLFENDARNTKKIQRAINFMRENDVYTIPQLAQMCNMSECRFYSVFNEVVGMTPVKMKHKIQTEKAEFLLLSTELSIDEVAHSVGFESTAHFRKIFKEHFGYSPKEVRKRPDREILDFI